MAEGDDPAPGVVKTLTVEYTVNGTPQTARATDPETIRLFGSKPRDAQVRRGERRPVVDRGREARPLRGEAGLGQDGAR